MTSNAPIVLFVYNRLPHLQATIEALQKNVEASSSLLYVYSDAAKNANSEPAVRKVREYLKCLGGFGEVHVIERAENFGLARSIIDGVTSWISAMVMPITITMSNS